MSGLLIYCGKCKGEYPSGHQCPPPEPVEKSPTEWDGESDFPCPHCGENVPYSEGMSEATVGSLFGPRRPHVQCPGCNECCGC